MLAIALYQSSNRMDILCDYMSILGGEMFSLILSILLLVLHRSLASSILVQVCGLSIKRTTDTGQQYVVKSAMMHTDLGFWDL